MGWPENLKIQNTMTIPQSNSIIPLSISFQTITEGAKGAFQAPLIPDPLTVIREAISRVQTTDLLELAERHLGRPVLDENQKPRSQSKSEIIVTLVEHFDNLLDQMGFGARVFNGRPHLYAGVYWKPVQTEDVSDLLGEFAERLGYHVAESRFYAFREKLLAQFKCRLSGAREAERPRRILINFSNGTLEFDDGIERMREFRKEDFLTYCLPFAYDESATCPIFDRYLSRVLPDQSAQNVLSEFLGWVFLRNLKLEKVLVLLGDGHNGKSVFFDIVNALLGSENVCNCSLSTLAKMEGRWMLGHALLNFGSEISDRCDADLFKKLASGEPIDTRRLYSDPYIMRDYARLAFNANQLPRDVEQTPGFFRRFLIVPFNEMISEAEKDPDLARKIIETELPGVFNWVMRGLRRLRGARKFSDCAAANEALACYRNESDSVALFLDEGGWQRSLMEKISKEALYSEYQTYCQSSGYKCLNKNNFGKRLQGQHLVQDSKSGNCRHWHLVRVNPEE